MAEELAIMETALQAENYERLSEEFCRGIGIDQKSKTAMTYKTNLKQFWTYLRSNGIVQPSEADVEDYKATLTAKGLAPATISAYIRTLKMFFQWAAGTGQYRNIAAAVRAPKLNHSIHKRDALTVNEALTVEESIQITATARVEESAAAVKDTAGRIQRSTEQGKRLYAMYQLALNCGLRTIELSRADVRDIKIRDGRAYLYVWGKGHSEADQSKPLAPQVYDALKDYLASRTDGAKKDSPLFVSTGNRKAADGRIAARTISGMLKRAMQEAGFDSDTLTAHSLRHTCGTACMEMTGDIYQTQKYLRHSNPATTEIYLHIQTEKQEAENADRLYNYYHGQAQADDAPALDINDILQILTPEQLAQLQAKAMQRKGA